MSWTDWANYMLADNHGIPGSNKCAIFGPDGAVWADVNELKFNSQNVEDIRKALTGSTSKVIIYDKKYFLLRAEPGEYAIFKCGQEGFTVAKTKDCLLVGHYDSSITPGLNTTCVMKTQQLLKDAGF